MDPQRFQYGIIATWPNNSSFSTRCVEKHIQLVSFHFISLCLGCLSRGWVLKVSEQCTKSFKTSRILQAFRSDRGLRTYLTMKPLDIQFQCSTTWKQRQWSNDPAMLHHCPWWWDCQMPVFGHLPALHDIVDNVKTQRKWVLKAFKHDSKPILATILMCSDWTT